MALDDVVRIGDRDFSKASTVEIEGIPYPQGLEVSVDLTFALRSAVRELRLADKTAMIASPHSRVGGMPVADAKEVSSAIEALKKENAIGAQSIIEGFKREAPTALDKYLKANPA